MRRHGTILLACAWVLWTHGLSTKGAESWEPFDSYEKLAECKQMADSFRKKPPPAGVLFSYVCLPDTINPLTAK